MRSISFSLTTPQFIAGTKDVTRRLGWDKLKDGEVLRAVEKAMGLKKGEQMKPLASILVVSARPERLDRMTTEPRYGIKECRREGFPDMVPAQFVEFFCRSHTGCFPERVVTRIEFKKLPLVRKVFALHMRHQHGATYGHNLVAEDGTVVGQQSSFTPTFRYRDKHPARDVYTMGDREFDTAAEFLVAYQARLDSQESE